MSSASSQGASWAGEYNCTGPCAGKRMIADKFSKSSLMKFKLHNKPLVCKQCNEIAQKQEQNVSSSVESSESSLSEDGTRHKCSSCQKILAQNSFNNNQLRKGPEKQRCKQCVQESEIAASAAIEEAKAEKYRKAEERLRLAEKSKNTAEILAASSALAALEGEKVTGMKPAVGGKGRGKGGRGRGQGSTEGCWERTKRGK